MKMTVCLQKKSRTKRECNEEEVEKVFSELQKKQDNTEKYATPQLRLWARMVAGGLHTSTEDPPKIPIFTGSSSSKEKPKSQDSPQEVLVATATAITKALKPQSSPRSSNVMQASPIRTTGNQDQMLGAAALSSLTF